MTGAGSTKRPKTARARRKRAAPHGPVTPRPKSKVSTILRVDVWLDPRDGKIRIVAPGQFITTVSDQPGKRLHKHLYSKLKAVLKKRGKWFEIV